MLERFRGCQQFDGKQIFRVFHDRPQFDRGRHPHRNMILLPGGSRDVVDAGGMRQHFRFVQKRRRRDLRNHHAGLQAGLSRKKSWQTVAQVRIHQALDSPFADAHQIRQGNGRKIQRKGQGRAVKISARNDITAFGKHKRIVGRARALDFQNLFHIP